MKSRKTQLGDLCSRAMAVTCFFCTAFSGAALLPDLKNESIPLPEPAAQNGWDIFTPPVELIRLTSNTPTVAEWTRTGRPDDSLILTGDQFSNNTGLEEGKDTEFLVYGQTNATDAVQVPAVIQKLDGLKAAITLPSALPPWSTYLVWPKNAAGHGSPIVINRTETWWINPEDEVAHKELVSIYGRNLSHDGSTKASWIYLKPAGGDGQWVEPKSVNPYRVQFEVPASLGNGPCEVWVHNGHGGSYGWSSPLVINVTYAYLWNGNIFNVRDFGATGDGVTDDADAISAANSAALTHRERTGLHPTLYFPAGTYLMRHGISLEHDLRYLGAGRDLTILRCHADFNQPSRPGDIGGKLGLLFSGGGVQRNIEVRDLTLDATHNFFNPGTDGYALNCAWTSGSDIRLVGLRIKVGNPEVGCVATHNTNRLTIVGCEFIGGILFLHRNYGVEISDCLFLNANYQSASLYELTTSNFSITDSRFQDLDPASPTGQGQGRLLAGNANQGAQHHAYIGDNLTINLGPKPGDNAGEQILCEGNLNTFDWGSPTGAQSGQVTFSDPLTTDYSQVAATAVITAGKGLGQYRRVTGWDRDRTITVSPNWNVIPDASSVVLIEAGTSRWTIYRNTLDGKSHYESAYSAMTAIEPYGGCYDWIGDSNTITNMRVGLYISAVQDLVSPKNRIHPCFFHYYANNIIQSCHSGILAACGSTGSNTVDPGVGFLGTIFRNNILTDITTTGVSETTYQTTGPSTLGWPLDMTLFEHNLFTNVPQGFDCDFNGPTRTKNTILYRNVFNLGTAIATKSFGVNLGITTLNPVFIANSWLGFATTFAGQLPSVSETPKAAEKPTGIRVKIWSY